MNVEARYACMRDGMSGCSTIYGAWHVNVAMRYELFLVDTRDTSD